MFDLAVIGEMCHELVRAVQKANGEDVVYPHWEDAEQWMRDSSIDMVRSVMDGQSSEQIHERWMAQRLAEGWRYGPVKDLTAKTNPNLVPYLDLPVRQWVKDRLVRAMIQAVTS